jgi:fermentation-respiration switch protein FrsA (DUF1100 family)
MLKAEPPPGYEHVFDYNRSVPLKASLKLRKKLRYARIYDTTYRAVDGQRVPGILVLPRGKRVGKKYACVTMGHGLGATKELVANGPTIAFLAKRGIGVFAIDARYHGARGSETLARERAQRPASLYEMFRLTVIDTRRGIDFLLAKTGCDPKRLGYIGLSMGGLLGAMLAGVDDRIAATALLVSGGDWRTIFMGTSVLLNGPLKRGAQLNVAVRKLAPLDPKFWVRRIAPRPVFFAAGRKDEFLPFRAAEIEQANARRPKTIHNFDGGHFIEPPYARDVYGAAFGFIVKALRAR